MKTELYSFPNNIRDAKKIDYYDNFMHDDKWHIYSQMRDDARITSLLTIRKSAAQLYQWDISGDPHICEHVKKLLSHLPITTIMYHMLNAIDYGMSVHEIIWARNGAWHYPIKLIPWEPWRFSFDDNHELTAHIHGKNHKLDTQLRFLIYTHQQYAHNPYGTSALRACYIPWKIKQAGLQYWQLAAERFGVPSILALFDGTNEQETKKHADSLVSHLNMLGSNSSAAMANVRDIKILEPNSNFNYGDMITMCDTQISYALTGQNLATGESRYASRAQAHIHKDAFHTTIRNDAHIIKNGMQKLITALIHINYGYKTPVPQFYHINSHTVPFTTILEALKAGIPISKQALYEQYGIPHPLNDDDILSL